MKIVIPGGSGQIGSILSRSLIPLGHDVVVLSRDKTGEAPNVVWDGKSVGAWADEIDGANVVINLAGRSVNCRYNQSNLNQMMSSRVDSTHAVGLAIAQAKNPPSVWLQMSTATIYSHRFDAPNDELTGLIGGNEPNVPAYWRTSVEIAQAWEQAQYESHTPQTRKIALRTGMVMSPDRGGIFDVLLRLVRTGLGGPIAGGQQYVSWIHAHDFVRVIQFLLDQEEIKGPVNLTAPNPLPQRDFMTSLRAASGKHFALPATKSMVKIGAFILRTDTELTLKSRRVVPTRLADAGFTFKFPQWPAAANDLVAKSLLTRKHSA